jgi:hypothetical protein
MNFTEKIAGAEELIDRVVREYRHPVVLASFGKDSMVILDILKRMGLKFPLLFHREPFSPSKFAFATRMIEEGDYEVYDYPPMQTVVTKKNGRIEIANCYQVGAGWLYLPNGVVAPEDGKPFLCGFKDLYQRPTGTFNFPWDVGFVGHKSSDVDACLGAIPLKVDVRENAGSCDYAFPLRHFTDADVWRYTLEFDVPFNSRRYNQDDSFREFADLTFNNDHYHACTRCLDRDEAETVFCPKAQAMIPNISATIRFAKPELPDYIESADCETAEPALS